LSNPFEIIDQVDRKSTLCQMNSPYVIKYDEII